MLRSSSSMCLISCSVGGLDPDPDTCPDPVGEAASPSSSASAVAKECSLQIREPVPTGVSEPSCCSGSADAVTYKHNQQHADQHMLRQSQKPVSMLPSNQQPTCAEVVCSNAPMTLWFLQAPRSTHSQADSCQCINMYIGQCNCSFCYTMLGKIQAIFHTKHSPATAI